MIDYFWFSRPHQATVENQPNKERLSENITSKKDDIKDIETLKNPENVRTPEIKWKSEIHSRKE